MTTYIDKAVCPKGHRFNIRRRPASAGFKVCTYCATCDQTYNLLAGPVPDAAERRARALLERDIEAHLVKRVKELGGEVRKVAWQGRVGAPDRVVMLPEQMAVLRNDWGEMLNAPGRPPTTLWVEVKAPGGAAKFPKNAHERAQHREHERMRRVGQRVVVVDSYEMIEEMLK